MEVVGAGDRQHRQDPRHGQDRQDRQDRQERWGRRLLLAASVVVVAHLGDEALLRPPEGVGWEARAGEAAAVAALLGLAGAAWTARPRRWLRRAAASGAAAVAGTVLTAHGAAHVAGAAGGAPDPHVATGVLLLPGGLALLALPAALHVVLPAGRLVGRLVGHGRSRTGWGRPLRAVAAVGARTVVATAVLVAVLVPVAVGTVQVHLPRRPPAPAPAADFVAVDLHTEDDVRLAGWWRPSRNGAAVVLVSTSRGDHGAVGAHARLLADHGYGVLVYDARGSGASDGAPNGWGWTWSPDVEAGLDFAAGRPGVGGVGLLGLSTGADVALEVAARDPRVRVVVADGATAQGFADRPPGLSSAVSLWPTYATATALTGARAQPPLTEAAAAISPRPVLLVAAGSIPQEIPLNERYARAGGAAVELWTLPRTGHTRALDEHPQDYAERVLGVLDRALVAPRPVHAAP